MRTLFKSPSVFNGELAGSHMQEPRTVLFVELPGNRPLPEATVLGSLGGGSKVSCLSCSSATARFLENNSESDPLMVINKPEKHLLEEFRKKFPEGVSILVTDLSMEQYASALSYKEDLLLDHIVGNSGRPEWTVLDLRTTLQKELRDEMFGISRYLRPGTSIISEKITHSDQRRDLNLKVMDYAESLRLTSATSKLLYGISEELLMNAIYDAPTDQNGKPIYGEIQRTKFISLKDHEVCSLSFGSDGETFALGVEDPFGALKKTKFHSYMKKVLRRHEGSKIIDTKKGGAGLGLFKILYSSHALICNSLPGRKTEVISLIDLHSQIRDFSRMARGLHFFQQRSGSTPASPNE